MLGAIDLTVKLTELIDPILEDPVKVNCMIMINEKKRSWLDLPSHQQSQPPTLIGGTYLI